MSGRLKRNRVARGSRSTRALPQPLDGVRVLDLATFLAGPFCASTLGEFGAEVIKIEQPKTGDPLRKYGTPVTPSGDTRVWLNETRNKKCITLELRKPKGAELFKRLVKTADVVVENFRPGTLEKWGLGYETLAAIHPGLVMVRISGFGQTGPKKDDPGFARIAHGFCGLSHLVGMPDGPPLMPGSTSLADYTSGLYGALGVLLALRVKERTGQGQTIDIGLYEPMFRLLDELAPAYARNGYVRGRMGADTTNAVPHSHYPTRDGKYVAIAATSDKMFERVAHAMGRPELAAPEQFGKVARRVEHREEVNRLVGRWTRTLDRDALLKLCKEQDVPCGPIYDIAEIFADPHYRARGNLLRVKDTRVGEITIPATVPRLSKTPGTIRSLGPELGEDNREVYRDLLGVDPKELRRLQGDGVI
jgi:crotonobetainyl-CoA:carnitine CoA-transferase CaiB-like acyl-CoA transferase